MSNSSSYLVTTQWNVVMIVKTATTD